MRTIVCFGDSITDMRRDRADDSIPFGLGEGYPFLLEERLGERFPNEFRILNRGISGNRSVDLYARLKEDVWNLKPDIVVLLAGVNDVWHEINYGKGVSLARFEKTVRNMIEETKETIPGAFIIVMEPFVLKGSATEERFDEFQEVFGYASSIKTVAEESGCAFVPLQRKLKEAEERHGRGYCLCDGVHPTVQGSRIIADSVLEQISRMFENNIR